MSAEFFGKDSNYTKNELPINRVHTVSLPFEDYLSFVQTASFMHNYWTLSFFLVVIYLIAIYLGLGYMRSRPKYNLRGPLFVWNIFLTILYVTGLVRVVSEGIELDYLKEGLVYRIICQECPLGCTKAINFWLFTFVFFKAPELLDSAFVILRKQPLFFLHYFHHSTVLIFTWYLYGHMSSVGLAFAFVNSIVHALMYFYYALKALSIRIPRAISMTLTLLQLSQMLLGIVVNYYAYQMKQRGLHCSVSYTDMCAAYAIYLSYFALFSWYFYKAYIAKDALIIKKFKGEKIE